MPSGNVSVADAYNCRVLIISPAHRVVRQYGTSSSCRHDPPRRLGAINAATPLPDGGILVSEINGSWVDDISAGGHLRWAVRAPVSYPSDPQLLAPNRILLADYARPGHAIIMTRTGRVLWRYGPSSGPGMLDHPSLAAMLPNGNVIVGDDFNDRIVIIDHGKVIADDTLAGLHRMLPVTNVLAIELESPDGFSLEQLRIMPDVKSAEIHEGVLRIGVHNLAMDTPGILKWLAEHGHPYQHLGSERPSLETVFLTLTGRSLRDS